MLDQIASRLAQRQLDAYNAKDLESFLACYTDDCEAFMLASGERRFRGKEPMRAIYGRLFTDHPHLFCELKSRSTMGRFAIDEEYLTGYADGSTRRATAIYETAGELICRIWFVTP